MTGTDRHNENASSVRERRGNETSGPPAAATAAAAATATTPAAAGEKGFWADAWTSLRGGLQTLELENKGSVARDHLALERTFLAWLRTSLAFASIGIAITQLFRLDTTGGGGDASSPIHDGLQTLHRVGRPLGSTFLAISILVLLLGYRRYCQSQQWVMKGKFPASRGTILIVSLVAFALMVASLVVVIVVQPRS